MFSYMYGLLCWVTCAKPFTAFKYNRGTNTNYDLNSYSWLHCDIARKMRTIYTIGIYMHGVVIKSIEI